MADFFNGYTLRGAKTSPTNANTSAPADSGVARDVVAPNVGLYPVGQPALVEARGDQYRVAVLESPLGGEQEFLVWAANTGTLTTLEGPAWATADGAGAIPQGSLVVFDTASPTGQSTDGSPRIIVTDNGGRDLAGVVSVTVVRGDSPATPFVLTLAGGDFSFVSGSGAITLLPTANTLAATQPVSLTDPAFSQSRGDRVTAISYWVSAARFWWTRNDPYSRRFGWNGATSKWEPYRGGAPATLGKLSSDGRSYALNPRPTTPTGSLLPGSDAGDAYAMVRLGASPDAASYPVVSRTLGDYSGVLVVPDDLANTSYNFTSVSPPLAGVIGSGAGKIVWNPAFIQTYEGLDVWYIQQTFAEKSLGVVGSLLEAKTRALFLAPVPGPGERPIVRLGNRQPLNALPFDTESDLAAATVLEGEVGFAISTGRIKLSAADISKADPGTRAVPNPGFDKLYLGAVVRYDGVSLNLYPQPVKAPVLLVDSGGTPVTSYNPAQEVFIPDAETLPALGLSGILQVPDGLGNPPIVGAVGPRPGNSGLVRKLSSGIGDVILFTEGRAVTNVIPVPFEDELPTDPFRVPGDVAYVALEKRAGAGSLVMFGSVPRKQLTGKPIYFRQGEFVPSSYAERARLFSRLQDTFTLDGTETLSFMLGGTSVLWLASSLGAGSYTASQVAASLNAAIVLASAPGSSYALSGRVVIAHTDPVTGFVSIGFGTGGVLDLSGCRALGFIPGWLASPPGDLSASDHNWLPDYGGEFGFYRSPRDLDGSQGLPDYRDKYRLSDRTLTENISPTSFQFLDFPPREDIAGYDEGVFFALSAAGAPGVAPVVDMPLMPWADVRYLFEEKKFAWLTSGGSTGQVLAPVAGINLDAAGVVPESLIAPLNGFLRLSEGGPFVYLEPGVDFLFPKGGATGEAILISRVGALKLSGSRGHFAAATDVLTDLNASFATVAAGDRLKIISGDAQGSYSVVAVPSLTSVQVSPSFLVGDGGQNISYEIYKGASPGTIDPTTVADVVYQNFNHLAEEPFEIRVLASLGAAGGVLAPADAAKDIERGRPIFARIGQTGTDLPLVVLTQSELGAAANLMLFVPTTGARFTSGSFNLRVGTQEFVQGVGLLPVAVFSPNPVNIEYLTSTGELKFSTAILDEYQSATVTYVETLLPAVDLISGQAEIDPNTGLIALSSVDLAAGAGLPVYFVEQLSTEGTDDLTANPILGAFTFLANPIRAKQLVEATYYRAVPNTGTLFLDKDGNPVRVKEFLPLYIRAEVMTRISSQLYSFNPTARTVDQLVSPIVYTGSKQQTYGVPRGCAVDFSRNTVSFSAEVLSTTKVTISYAVFEAFGGETAYTVSMPPVWRPPFRLDKNQTQFLLDTNRTSDVVVGKAFRVGAFTTYVKSVFFDATSDTTLVTVFPSTPQGAGSLNPGENALSLLTDRPVAITVDPFGTSPVTVAGSDVGFLPTMAQAFNLPVTPHFEPVPKGQVEIKFDGDLTKYAVAGHLLELFGKPFAIAKAAFSADGRVTTISVSTPFQESFTWSATMPDSAARISARPIYPEGAIQFLGTSAFLPTEPFEVVLFGEMNATGDALPGRTLTPGQDYSFIEGNGNIAFIEPRQAGISANHRIVFARTDTQQVGPYMDKGQIQYPRVSSSFLYVDPPSARNGRLGGVLQGTYTFESPDAYYVRMVPFQTYVGEVSLELQKQATAQEPSNGPNLSTGASKSNADYGRLGLVSESQNLVDRDRAARAFLGFYNAVVSSFEQIEETLDGSLVGERDGKLRLYIGKNDPWVPPGYEDAITGALNPRMLWFDVWMSARQGLPTIRLVATDPITNPLDTTTDSNGRPVGSYQDPSGFGSLIGYQDVLIKNDVDDVVLLTRTRIQRKLAGFIYFRVTASGMFAPLSEANPFSRLFPERTTGFTTLGPGLDGDEATGNPGVYSAGKFGFDPLGFLFGMPFSLRSTTGSTIGALENPVLGQIQNVLGVQARDRLARARIWAYSATGFPEVDPLSAGRPCFIATPLPLVDFPILSDTGLPDTSKLASQSVGPIPTGFNDLLTGDPELHTPPFSAGAQLSLGVPEGNFSELGYTGTLIPIPTLPPSFRYAGIFVEQVLKGCIVTLKSKNLVGADVPVLNAALLISLTGPTSGVPINPEIGDTLFVVPVSGASLPATADPPTIAELQTFATALPEYRPGTDFNFTSRTGEITDATLPSFADPTLFGLKEITGQRPPAPLSTLEAQIAFQNGSRLPTRFPALEGGKTLDSGDYSLPYYGAPLSELEILGDTAALITDLIRVDSPSPPPVNPPQVHPYTTEAVYPDETLGADGTVSTNSSLLATLSLFEDLSRKTTSGAYPPPPGHAGVGNVEPYDLLLIQAPTGIPGLAGFPAGSTGIHSIADIANGAPNQVDLPRFASVVTRGTSFNYLIDNAISWVNYPAYATGIVVKEDTTLIPTETTFDVSSVGAANIVLDDGVGGGLLPIPVGGLNDVFAFNGKGSLFTVKLIDKTTGQFALGSTVIVHKTGGGANILLCSFEVSGDGGGVFVPIVPGGFYFEPGKVVIKTAAPNVFFDFVPYNPVVGPPGVTTTGGFHDFSFSVLCLMSQTGYIDSDRVTFGDRIDFRTALPRGFIHPSSLTGSNMACSLATLQFEASVFDTVLSAFVLRDNQVNNVGTLNAGLPFTFPARSWITPSVNDVGTWAANSGSLRVLGFEGRGNVPIEATEITFTAIPSSRQDETGPIFNGLMIVGEALGVGAPFKLTDDNNFFPFGSSSFTGNLSLIQPGDIAVIKGLADPTIFPTGPFGSGKVGTYLIRAAVTPTPGTPPGHQLLLSTTLGSVGDWLPFTFPTVVSFNSLGPDLTVTSLLPMVPLQDLNAAPVAVPFAFPPSGRVYVILDSTAVGLASSAVSAAYTSLDTFGIRFLGLSTFQDGVGAAISLAQFQAAAVAGLSVSGMTVVPVAAQDADVPANLPGITFWPAPPPGGEFFFGFRKVTATRVGPPVIYDASVFNLVGVPPAPGQIAVYSKVKVPSTSFLQLDQPVYDNIPGALDLTNFNWPGIHGAGPACLLPGDVWDLEHHARQGIFVEPSFPVSGNDLGRLSANVVDATHSLTAAEVGSRDITSYLGAGPAGGSYLEFGQVEVRRIRRFHPLLNDLVTAFLRLRFVYEIRRGIVQTFTSTGSAGSLVAEPVNTLLRPLPLVGGTATQLGDFTDPKIGIKSGDQVRFIDTLGVVVAEAEVLVVETDGKTLTISKNALTSVAPGTRFEVYLRTAPIPHEQSCEELLDLATDKLLLDRKADLIAQTGGKVTYLPGPDLPTRYATSINKLSDTDPTVNFAALGIQPGDVLVIDPEGVLRGPTGFPVTPEKGTRPFGDDGVLPRGAPVYVPGTPSRTDDNRGYYKVLTATATQLEVVPLGGTLAGGLGTDVVFDSAYAVYPTIHGSNLSGTGNGIEGQMDLRPTAFCNGANSFKGDWLSVAPFAYKVIRPSGFLTEETVELILSTRERMLSWIEELQGLFEANKSGTYFVFQRDQHIADLGDPSDPSDGLGVLFDAYITSLEGRIFVSPFANTSDCLSILDRRFWGLDFRLDYLRPPFAPLDPPYSDFVNGFGRPVLPDRIEEALQQRDKLRDSRWAWLTLRTDRVTGTIEAIRRFGRELPRRHAEQERLLTMVKGTQTP